MPRAIASLVWAAIVIAVASCSNPADRAVERLRNDIEAYTKAPSEAGRTNVDADFAQLEAEIAALRAEAAREELPERERTQQEIAELERTRDDLRADYLRAEAHAVTDAAEDAVRSVGESIGRGIEEAGKRLREAASKRDPGASIPPDDTR